MPFLHFRTTSDIDNEGIGRDSIHVAVSLGTGLFRLATIGAATNALGCVTSTKEVHADPRPFQKYNAAAISRMEPVAALY